MITDQRTATVVSVSLGSSRRDHEVEVDLLDRHFHISRRGTDGNFKQALDLLKSLDGTVDAIGLGGVDIYLYSRRDRFALRDGLRLKNAVQKTRVVDGSGLKNSLEREIIKLLARHHPEIPIQGRKVLMVSGMDRFGMAEAFVEAGAHMTYGDLIFALDRNQPIHSLDELADWADRLLPELCKMPIGFLYPIGKQQDAAPDEKYAAYYHDADIIAGDYHFIRKYMPARLDGKVIVTNTVTPADVEDLAARGVAWLVATTPDLKGRSFGTNVLEAAMLVLLDKDWDDATSDDYLNLIRRLDLRPRVEYLHQKFPSRLCLGEPE